MADSDLRVLHITESFGSGVATAIEGYVSALPEVTSVVCGAYRQAADASDRKLSCDFIELPHSRAKQMQRIRGVVSGVDPDVVHVHSSWAGAYTRLPILRRALGDRHVVYTPHAFAFERLDISGPTSALFTVAERLCSANTDSLAVSSLFEVTLAIRLGLRPPVVYLPYRLPRKDERIEGNYGSSDAADSSMVLGVGRLAPQKGIDFFIQAKRSFDLHGTSGRAVRWVWAGDGEAGLRSALEDAGIQVTGWLSRDDTLAYVRSATVYLHSAEWEGFPLTILEAARENTPMVVRRIPAVSGMGLEACLIAKPDEMGDRVHRLLSRPHERRDLQLRLAQWLVGRHSRNAQGRALRIAYGLPTEGRLEDHRRGRLGSVTEPREMQNV